MLGLTGGTLSAPQPRGSSVRGGYEESSKTHTLSPTVTGSSVVGIKYRDGVMLAADTLASYGSQARFKVSYKCIGILGEERGGGVMRICCGSIYCD